MQESHPPWDNVIVGPEIAATDVERIGQLDETERRLAAQMVEQMLFDNRRRPARDTAEGEVTEDEIKTALPNRLRLGLSELLPTIEGIVCTERLYGGLRFKSYKLTRERIIFLTNRRNADL